MLAVQDGPAYPNFHPLRFKTAPGFMISAGAEQTDLPVNISPEMAISLKSAPSGKCVSWGIPFDIEQFVLLSEQPVSLEVDPVLSRWLIFLHTSDIRPMQPGAAGLISPMRGHGQLAEHAADYDFVYADGSLARALIRRQFQIGAFQRPWGENCFECVAHHKPQPVPAPFEKPHAVWGYGQTRVSPADAGPWVNWLWAWENPYPEKALTGFIFTPASGAIILSAITAGNVGMHPLRWRTRQKARLVLPPGESFLPELDGDGRLKQIQLDLGQVISAAPRPVYPVDSWPETYHNQLPQRSSNEILVDIHLIQKPVFTSIIWGEARQSPFQKSKIIPLRH